jgi:hypothetical protein
MELIVARRGKAEAIGDKKGFSSERSEIDFPERFGPE